LMDANCLGYGKSLMRSHLPCWKRKSLIDLCISTNCVTTISWLAKSLFTALLWRARIWVALLRVARICVSSASGRNFDSR
jgi:hypothetical protein